MLWHGSTPNTQIWSPLSNGQRPPATPATPTRLAAVMSEYQSWRRHLTDRLTVAQHALDAAQHHGDRHGEGTAWDKLGLALQELRQFDEARRCLSEAAAAYADTGDTAAAQVVEQISIELRETSLIAGKVTTTRTSSGLPIVSSMSSHLT